MHRVLIISLILAVCSAPFAQAGRGPIIRAVELKAGARTLDVTWRTETPGDSTVKLGAKVVKDDRQTTSHQLSIADLTPSTAYPLEVTSSDGKVTSHYRKLVKTAAPHDGLIRQYGKAMIESLEEKMGPLDETNLDPKVESYLAMSGFIRYARRGARF